MKFQAQPQVLLPSHVAIYVLLNHFNHVTCFFRITTFLGSGAFGTVNKGLWQSPGGAIEVAIKTIQGSNEEEKVKFLQEAAIMGQFRHPNVVKLMGVVTVGEPVSILRLMKHNR